MSVLSWLLAAHLAATPITLDEVRAASRRNLQAVRAELDVDRARAGAALARSTILPHVEVSAGAGQFFGGAQRIYTTAPVAHADGTQSFEQVAVDVPGQSRSSFSLQVSATQLIYDGGRWWTQIAQAGAQERALAGQLEEQRLASELEASRRFYELLRAQVALRVLEASVTRSEAQLQRARALYEAARVQRRDVLDAEVNLGNDRIQVLRQQQSIQAAQLDLLGWLGEPAREVVADEPKAMRATAAPEAVPDEAKALEKARTRRPLLASLAAQVEGAEQGVTVAESDFAPRVAANVSLARQGSNADPFFTDPTKQNSASLGVSLSWAVFNGFATDAQVQRARVEVAQAKAQREQARLELEAEVSRSVKAVGTLLAIATIAEQNVSLSGDQLALEEERYAVGVGSSLEVRNAQLKLAQAQLTQLTGRVDVEIARAMLRRSIGGDVEGAP